MKDYEVTLSIPVYNVEKYIHTALFSALNQNFESIEFLIVDDKGTDRSMELVNEIVSTHLRKNDIRIIDNLVNKGLSECRNIAVRERRGNICILWIVMTKLCLNVFLFFIKEY